MHKFKLFGAGRSAVGRRCGLRWLLPLLIALFFAPCFRAQGGLLDLAVVNTSGFSDEQIYFIVTSADPAGYLDFQTHAIVPMSPFVFDAARMTASLAQIKAYSVDGSATIRCPEMIGGRVYFALGQNFDRMGGFSPSGPEMWESNPVPWHMFELTIPEPPGAKYINATSVDFFSVAYTLTARLDGGHDRTVGISTPSSEIFDAFTAIPASPAGQLIGNNAVISSMIVRDPSGEVVRVVAPKTAAYARAHTAQSQLPQAFTHYLDNYINNHCWRPNRTFSFASKIAGDHNTYYGRVSADGLTLSIYTDAAMTVPYAPAPTLPRPSNAWGHPDFAADSGLWHNVGNAGTDPENIDWGFLLYGDSGYDHGPGAHWHTDDVVISIPASIVRGVMHLDNGTVDWKDRSKYFRGANGVSTADFPIFYYAAILHHFGVEGQAYALSYDDVYGMDPTLVFTGTQATLQIFPFSAPPALGPCIRANGRRGTVNLHHPEQLSLSVSMNAGGHALPADWWVLAVPQPGASWYYLNTARQWQPFPANLFSACRPVYSGPLGDLPPTTVLPPVTLDRGVYRIYFAVDFPMDGQLHYPGGEIYDDEVTVVIH